MHFTGESLALEQCFAALVDKGEIIQCFASYKSYPSKIFQKFKIYGFICNYKYQHTENYTRTWLLYSRKIKFVYKISLKIHLIFKNK